jgi:WD40 repeat protein
VERAPGLWALEPGAGVPLAGQGAGVNRLAFSRVGRALWTARADQTVRRWDVATGESRVVARGLGRAPVFALPPDDRWIATSGVAGRVALVDPATLTERVLGRHDAAVYRLAFSPDGARLASAGRDHTVRLWDVRRGVLEAVLQHEHEVLSVAFSPDGRWLASVGEGAVVRLWPAPSGDVVPSDPRGLAAWMATLSTAALAARESGP